MSDAQNDVFYVRDRRQPYHYTVDNEIYDMRLGVYALGVYNALAYHVAYEGEKREQAAITHKQIAEELSVGLNTVKRALKKLAENNLVAVEARKGFPSVDVLLEVKKAVPSKKYQRREGSPVRTTHPGRADSPERTKGRPPKTTPRPPGAKGSPEGQGRYLPKSGAGKGISGDPEAPKRKTSKEKISARGAQSPPSEPSNPEDKFIGRVLKWHDQCAKVTKANYRLLTISYQLRARIKQVGLKRAKEIFEHRANGVKPDVHAFWLQLNEEGEASKIELSRIEKGHMEIPVEVEPEKQAVSA